MYRLTADPDAVVRLADGAQIPRGHRWWDEYAAWLAAGHAAEPEFSLDQRRAQCLGALDVVCGQRIADGIVHDALGSAHRYPLREDAAAHDQTNLMAAVVRSLLPDVLAGWRTVLTCQEPGGDWVRSMHTLSQLRAVAAAAMGHVQACRARRAELAAQIMTAEAPEVIDCSTGWPS